MAVVVLGLLFVISAGRRLMPVREDLAAMDDPTLNGDDGPRTRLIAFLAVAVGFGVGRRPGAPARGLLTRRGLLDG